MESTSGQTGAQKKVIRRVKGSKSLSRDINNSKAIPTVSAVAGTTAEATLIKSAAGSKPAPRPSLTKGGACTPSTTQLHTHSSTSFKQRKLKASTEPPAPTEVKPVKSVVSGEPAPRPSPTKGHVDTSPTTNLHIGSSTPFKQGNVLKKCRPSEPAQMANPPGHHSCVSRIANLFRRTSDPPPKAPSVISNPSKPVHKHRGHKGRDKAMERYDHFVGPDVPVTHTPDGSHPVHVTAGTDGEDIEMDRSDEFVGPDAPVTHTPDVSRRCPSAHMNNPKHIRRPTVPKRGRKMTDNQARWLAAARAKENIKKAVDAHIALWGDGFSLPASDKEVGEKVPVATPTVVEAPASEPVCLSEDHGSGVINELSASSSNEALRNPPVELQELAADHGRSVVNELSATASHEALRNPPAELQELAADSDNTVLGSPVVLTPLVVPEIDSFGAGFLGTILADERATDVPEVKPLRLARKSDKAASHSTLPPLDEDSGGFATPFRFGERRVEVVEAVPRIPLASGAGVSGAAGDFRLDGWPWASVPDVRLKEHPSWFDLRRDNSTSDESASEEPTSGGSDSDGPDSN